MPTYLCFAAAGSLTESQKERLAKAITTIHCEEAIAPRYYAQVLFRTYEPGEHFMGGEPAPAGQIWIRGEIRAGRTEGQKSRLLLRLVEEVSVIADTPPDNVWVYLSELPAANMVEFGQLLPPPGGEDAWFQGLPAALRERLLKRL